MKLIDNYDLMFKVREKLGDPNLVMSMAIDGSDVFFSVSTHKSEKYVFDHGGLQRTCSFLESEYNRDIDEVANELVGIYEEIFMDKKEFEEKAEKERKDVAKRIEK